MKHTRERRNIFYTICNRNNPKQQQQILLLKFVLQRTHIRILMLKAIHTHLNFRIGLKRCARDVNKKNLTKNIWKDCDICGRWTSKRLQMCARFNRKRNELLFAYWFYRIYCERKKTNEECERNPYEKKISLNCF